MTALARLVAWAASLALLTSCAGSYFRDYQRAHPEWVFAFPDTEANLEQTIASLYAPPPLGTQLSIRRLDILRVDATPWQPIAFDELRSGRFTSDAAATYAVVAHFTCRGRVDLQVYQGEKIGWYLLPENRLRAFDHYEFVEGCSVHNDFAPTSAEHAAVEREVEAYVAAHYPPSMVHVEQLYQKGIAYARVDRVDDAKRMLREGSRAFDASGDDKATEFETPGVHLEVTRPDDAKSMRELLVREIAAAEARAHTAR